MADDTQPGSSRRQLIERGALAAGFIWVAPKVRTVTKLGTPGTPPPTSGSSTTRPTKTYVIATTVTGTLQNPARAGCPAGALIWHGEVELPGFGATTIDIDACGGDIQCNDLGDECTFPLTGTFDLLAPGGQVTGTVTGQVIVLVRVTITAVVDEQVTINGGTGDFSGANGTLVLHGDGVTFSINGSFEVPA